jgi:hypothetical protein
MYEIRTVDFYTYFEVQLNKSSNSLGRIPLVSAIGFEIKSDRTPKIEYVFPAPV